MKKNNAVLILAGGSGTRFWPWSTKKIPKQLLPIYSNKTLLWETWERAHSVAKTSHIFIGCNASLKKEILSKHKSIPPENFIVEPGPRNTAPIIALAALVMQQKLGDVNMIVLSADHRITPVAEFQKNITTAVAASEAGYLVTLGIKPTRPDTGYGYILRGKELNKVPNATGVYQPKSFTEKPDLKTANRYLKSGKYFWNAGIFIWKVSYLLDQLREHAPAVMEPLDRYFPFAKAGELARAFNDAEANSIDYLLLEKSNKLAMVAASFDWDDVGTWQSMTRFLSADDYANQVKTSNFIQLDSSGNLVFTENKLVAMLGVKDMIVIQQGDSIFVADKSQLDKMKKLLEEFPKKPGAEKYL